MMLPTIHLNGTSARELLKQYTDAMNAVDAAIEAVRKAYPNGRDYYPQGPDAIGAAMSQHEARLGVLGLVRKELEELAMHVYDAGRV